MTYFSCALFTLKCGCLFKNLSGRKRENERINHDLKNKQILSTVWRKDYNLQLKLNQYTCTSLWLWTAENPVFSGACFSWEQINPGLSSVQLRAKSSLACNTVLCAYAKAITWHLIALILQTTAMNRDRDRHLHSYVAHNGRMTRNKCMCKHFSGVYHCFAKAPWQQILPLVLRGKSIVLMPDYMQAMVTNLRCCVKLFSRNTLVYANPHWYIQTEPNSRYQWCIENKKSFILQLILQTWYLLNISVRSYQVDKPEMCNKGRG